MGALRDLIRGKGAHLDPLAAVEDVSWDIAGRRIVPFHHTIWQQLCHQNYWIAFELKCIEGPEQPVPAEASASWPVADGPSDEAAWQLELATFRTNLAQLEALAEAKASTLARIVRAKKELTVESVLWLLVAHHSYHTGQIVQLRQALGAWPPARGTTTW